MKLNFNKIFMIALQKFIIRFAKLSTHSAYILLLTAWQLERNSVIYVTWTIHVLSFF